MEEAKDLDKQRRAAILAEEVLKIESPRHLWCWTLRHLEQIDEYFFSALERSEVLDVRGHCQAETIARYVRQVFSKRASIEKQVGLLREIVSSTHPLDRRRHLKAHLPEINAEFFGVLICRAAERSYDASEATYVCEEILELVGLNDLREDWDTDTYKVLRGAAFFVQRDQPFVELLYADRLDQPIPYRVIQDSLQQIKELEEREKSVLALAILNVLLPACGHVVFESPSRSFTDVALYQVLICAARLIQNLGINKSIANAHRVLAEGRLVLDRALLSLEEEDPFLTFKLASDQAATLDLLSGLALEENKPEEALLFLQDALQQREEIRATTESMGANYERQMNLGLANTLWRLANTEVRLWRLDAAAEHKEKAINMYRDTGDRGEYLARHIQELAKIEFLRTNFDRAEALLEEADSERQAVNV